MVSQCIMDARWAHSGCAIAILHANPETSRAFIIMLNANYHFSNQLFLSELSLLFSHPLGSATMFHCNV